MTNASITDREVSGVSVPEIKSTINPEEAAHFGALAAEWWDPDGSSAMLHRLNPVRLGYIRNAINLHFGVDAAGLREEMEPIAAFYDCLKQIDGRW